MKLKIEYTGQSVFDSLEKLLLQIESAIRTMPMLPIGAAALPPGGAR